MHEGKVKAKITSKSSQCKAEKVGERIVIDNSGSYKPTLKGSHFCLKIVDDKSRYTESYFVKHK